MSPILQQQDSSDFVSLSSHELRSPLSIIKWYLEILLDGDAGPLTDEQRKYLGVIGASNQRAIDLVRSLLNVSRLDLDTFSVSPQTLLITDVLTDSIQQCKSNIDEKSVTIIREDSSVSKPIQADKHLCQMIITQLLMNAVTFSKQGGSVIVATPLVQNGSTHFGMTLHEESVVVTVTDQGIGIPVADQPHIFTKMFKASNVKESESTGSGLGLYIVKSILDHVGGTIWFTSVEGSGSTFCVAFPTSGMKKKEGKTTLD